MGTAAQAVRKHALTLAMVAAAVVVGAYTLVVDTKGPSTDDAVARRDALFPLFRRLEATRVELKGELGALVVERAARDAAAPWVLRAPVNEAADASAVDAWLALLESARIVRSVDEAVVSRAFASPRATGVLATPKATYRYWLGAEAPAPVAASYVRVEGRGAFVVAREVAAALQRDAAALRERALVSQDERKGAKVTIGPVGCDAQMQVLEPMAPGVYRLVRQGQAGPRMSRDLGATLADALSDLRADWFLEDADAVQAQPIKQGAPCSFQTGADGAVNPKDSSASEEKLPVLRIELHSAATSIELDVGGACPAHDEDVLVVRRGGQGKKACAPKAVYTKLKGLVLALQPDRRVFVSRFDEVEEFNVTSRASGRAVEMARKGVGFYWRTAGRELSSGEAESVAAWLKEAVTLEGEVLGQDAAMAFEPTSRVTIRGAGPLGQEDLDVGIAASGAVMVRRLSDRAMLRLPQAAARWLDPSGIQVKDASIFPEPWRDAEVTSLATTCPARFGAVAQSVERIGPDFMFHHAPAPGINKADTALVLDAVATLLRTKADPWFSEADDGTFAFDAAPCFISLRAKTPNGDVKAETLWLVRSSAGEEWGRLGKNGPVFRLAVPLMDVAQRWLVDPVLVPASAEALSEVAVEAPKAPAEGPKSISTARRVTYGAMRNPVPEVLAAAIAFVRSTGVAHFGDARAAEGFGSPRMTVTWTAAGHRQGRTGKLVVGATVEHNGKVHAFVRRSGVGATYLVEESVVQGIVRASFPIAGGIE